MSHIGNPFLLSHPIPFLPFPLPSLVLSPVSSYLLFPSPPFCLPCIYFGMCLYENVTSSTVSPHCDRFSAPTALERAQVHTQH